MKIGMISDTHGSITAFQQAMSVMGEVDVLIHLGDVLYHGPRNDIPTGYDPKALSEALKKWRNVIYVRGNCDSEVDEMVLEQAIPIREELIELGEHKIYATHGHRESLEESIQKAENLGATLLLWGHSHIKTLERRSQLILCNPGSTTIPKDGCASFAVLDDEMIRLVDAQNGEILRELPMEDAKWKKQ